MKTKPYVPTSFTPEPDLPAPVGFAVDLPCMMTGAGLPLAGPFPLSVCMLQGIRLSRLGSTFSILNAEGVELLALENGVLYGEEVLAALFAMQGDVADGIFEDMRTEAARSVSS